MTALDLAVLTKDDLKAMSVDELAGVKRQANDALRTVGESPKFMSTPNPYTGMSYNLLEYTAKQAQAWIDIKEGR